MSFLKRLVPTPLLSLALLAVWVLLARSFSAGQIVLGLLIALAVPHMTAGFRPDDMRVRRPLVILRFIATVGYDVLRSNLLVGFGVLAWRWRQPRAAFVRIPLDMRSPYGLAALAMVTTVVPGTVWSEIALDRSAFLLHVWDVDDEERFAAYFKARYEKPLMEIFE